MVSRLHGAGLEVILDVVYNHTAEGNERGPTLSFKGIDNASYYRLMPDKRYYLNDTGVGNTVNLGHPRVMQMVMDSLRYWAGHMHIDGFRFDLGIVLGAGRRRIRRRKQLPESGRSGPAAQHRQIDRRTMGCRDALQPRRLSAGLGGMERQIP